MDGRTSGLYLFRPQIVVKPPVLEGFIALAAVFLLFFRAFTGGSEPSILSLPQMQGTNQEYRYFPIGDFSLKTADTDEEHRVTGYLFLAYPKTNTALEAELRDKIGLIRGIVTRLIESKQKTEMDESVEKDYLGSQIRDEINRALTNGRVEGIEYKDWLLI